MTSEKQMNAYSTSTQKHKKCAKISIKIAHTIAKCQNI